MCEPIVKEFVASAIIFYNERFHDVFKTCTNARINDIPQEFENCFVFFRIIFKNYNIEMHSTRFRWFRLWIDFGYGKALKCVVVYPNSVRIYYSLMSTGFQKVLQEKKNHMNTIKCYTMTVKLIYYHGNDYKMHNNRAFQFKCKIKGKVTTMTANRYNGNFRQYRRWRSWQYFLMVLNSVSK